VAHHVRLAVRTQRQPGGGVGLEGPDALGQPLPPVDHLQDDVVGLVDLAAQGREGMVVVDRQRGRGREFGDHGLLRKRGIRLRRETAPRKPRWSRSPAGSG
jgi:hypothetical protein